MKNFKPRLLMTIACLPLLAVPALAQAPQQVAAADVVDSTEIIVTARKRSEKLQDVPVAITAFDQAEIRSARIERLADLAKLTPGLNFTPLFGAQNQLPIIRGAAQSIAAACGVVPDLNNALTEMDVGETEGLAFPEMRQRFPEFLAEWVGSLGHQVRMPGGESIEDVALRLAPFLELVLESNAPTLVIVSHNFVLRVLLCELLGLGPAAFRAFTVDLASISEVGIERGRASLHYLNDTCHLADLNVDQRRVSV